MPITFGYWGIKGLGGYCRLVAKHCGVALNEVNPEGPAWFGGEKFNTGLDFPNLPYLIDGDFKITEHTAINQYLAMSSGNEKFLGEGVQNKAKVQMVNSVVQDIINEFFKVAFTPEYKDGMTKNSEEKSKTMIKAEQLSKFLGTNDFFVGNRVSIADFKLAYFFDFVGHAYMSAELENPLAKFENLVNHHKRVYELPAIKELVTSPAWVNAPYMPPHLVPWVKLPGA